MPQLYDELTARRDIVDRRALASRLAALPNCPTLRADVVALARETLERGRETIAARLSATPGAGHQAAAGAAYLTDAVVRLLHAAATTRLTPPGHRTAGERVALVAVGGYGRAEMAPQSDVDLAFLTPGKPTGWTEGVVETVLYGLWDLGLTVGQSVRSVDESVRLATGDLTTRTSLLEARFLDGDRPLHTELRRRFWDEVVPGTDRAFVASKLLERDERHRRMGDSRYVVEPNVKNGKGALRDLHTLFWIGKYVHQVQSLSGLVERGLLTATELRQFRRSANFLWAVRCHLQLASGQPGDRLTFDLQREVAERMRYRDRPGKSAVERFMQHYFLTAKTVGDLTGVFLAHLDETSARAARRFSLPSWRRSPRALDGFVLDRGRIASPRPDWFREDPVRLVQLFQLADANGVEVHPLTMRAARRDARLIDEAVRCDPRANALFLDVLTSRRDPEPVLRWMNEANVLGRFLPDFGRVVAQMQFDMYHHYTVDEHTIRALGLLGRIERGEMVGDHPLASVILRSLSSRRVLYLAVLCHDIAKGRGGDHSILGAQVAERLGPRLGLEPWETETVVWLVRWHLLMSHCAFKRDVADPQTVLNFAGTVQLNERLRLLLVLTVVDIRAVGPGSWTGWKRQLLTQLFDAAEEVLRLGHMEHGRADRIAVRKEEVAELLALSPAEWAALSGPLPDSYWIAETAEVIAFNLTARVAMAATGEAVTVACRPDPDRDATLVTVLAPDESGLFARLAGAISLAGANIVDARIHTGTDGMALDNFLVSDPLGSPFDDPHRLERLAAEIRDALAERRALAPALARRPRARMAADSFDVAPRVVVDSRASNRFTVVEVTAADRPALLHALARALADANVTVRSAHVATFGERAVDSFYITDLLGQPMVDEARIEGLRTRLLTVVREEDARAAA